MTLVQRMAGIVAGVVIWGGSAQALPLAAVPASLADVDGGLSHSLLFNAASRIQQIIYDNDVLAAAGIVPGSVLSGISFRANGGTAGTSQAISFGDWTVRIGVAANSAAGAGYVFDNNVVGGSGGYTTVRSGSLSLGAGYFPATGAAVNPFSAPIGFDTSFVYTGAGEGLVVTFAHDIGSATITIDSFVRGTESGIASFNAQSANAIEETTGNVASGSTSVVAFDVPEPMMLSVLGLGGLALAGVRRRRRQ